MAVFGCVIPYTFNPIQFLVHFELSAGVLHPYAYIDIKLHVDRETGSAPLE